LQVLEHFGRPTLAPLQGRVDFDDKGVRTSEGAPPVFNAELRMEGDLERYQASLSRVTHRFEGSQTFRFEILVPFTEELSKTRSLRGEVVLWDLDRDTELARIPVHVARIDPLDAREVTDRWVLDFGGQSTMIGGEQAGPGGVPAFRAYSGMPLPSKVALTHGQVNTAPALSAPTEQAGDAAEVVIGGLKTMLDWSESGPPDAYPHTGVELSAFHLGCAFKKALVACRGRPRRLVVTVPADFSSHQVDHYRQVLGLATEQIGAWPLDVGDIEVLDEATAGGVGVLQELLEELDGPAMEQIFAGRDRPFHYVGIDIGATTTDLCLVSVEVTREDRRRIAHTHLEALVGFPVGGRGMTRLVELHLLARLALAADKSPPSEITGLARGDIDSIGDPYLSDPENPKTRRALDYLTDFLAPHRDEDAAVSRATRRVLFEVAEELKTRLNTPLSGDDPNAYPDRAELDPEAAATWADLCAYHGLAGAAETVALDAETLRRLFAPALRRLVEVVAGLCRVNAGPVDAICLTGNGSRLRALRSELGNVLLDGLTDDVFDRHPRRLFHAREPKLAVAKGAFAVFHGAAQARDWEWRCSGLLDVLPYDLGRITAANNFEVLVPRGTKLPHQVAPPNRPRELTLFKRAYPGDTPSLIGTVTFESVPIGAEPAIKIDRERRVTNQADLPIAPPLRSNKEYGPQFSERDRYYSAGAMRW
jgi:hypothetical protein